MTYTRSYPNDFTQNGSKVKKGFENDDAELKRIYGIIDNFGSLSLAGTKRQSVLNASANDGEPNYLTASGLNVSVDGSATNALLAFAYGFNDNGAVDFLEKISALVTSAWTLPSNSTAYLYVDRDISTNLISYGYSSLEDVYQKTAPTATLDQHWYDVSKCQMLRYNGSAWEVKQRIFVAKAVTTASATTLTIYPLRSRVKLESNLIGDVVGDVTGGLTGNADTADKLNNKLTVMGNDYDGSEALTVEAATQLEAEAGTDNGKIMTALRCLQQLAANIKSKLNASGDAPIYACRAWVTFSADGTVLASGNVSSVTRVSAGTYTINFTTAMPDANYSAIGTTGKASASGVLSGLYMLTDGVYQPTTTSVTMRNKARYDDSEDVVRGNVAIFK